MFNDIKPLSDEEYELINQATDIINEVTPIKCTECNYCIEHCPVKIPISKYFNIYNSHYLNKTQNGDLINATCNYLVLAESEENGAASECVECLSCEKYCPQHLDIHELLKDVDKELNNPDIKEFLST